MSWGKVYTNNHCTWTQSLLVPGKAQYHTTLKQITKIKRRLELKDQADITFNKNLHSCYRSEWLWQVDFQRKYHRNYLDKRLRLGMEDAKAINNYFVKRRAKISYMLKMDEDGRLWNVFLKDARSGTMYELFGEAVTLIRCTWQINMICLSLLL